AAVDVPAPAGWAADGLVRRPVPPDRLRVRRMGERAVPLHRRPLPRPDRARAPSAPRPAGRTTSLGDTPRAAGRALRAQAVAGCVVGLLESPGTRAGLRFACGRLDHEAH